MTDQPPKYQLVMILHNGAEWEVPGDFPTKPQARAIGEYRKWSMSDMYKDYIIRPAQPQATA